MNIQLKVKICTLAAESKIIRTQQRNLEKRAGKPPARMASNYSVEDKDKIDFVALRLERKKYRAKLAIIKMGQKPLFIWPTLHYHRRHEVRSAARSALLAYGFLRNRPYFALEHKYHTEPDWEQVEKNIRRFTMESDVRIVLQRYEQWRQRGREEQNNHKGKQEAA